MLEEFSVKPVFRFQSARFFPVAGTTVTITAENVSRARELPPDKLRRSLRGDLDNIVLKALKKRRKCFGAMRVRAILRQSGLAVLAVTAHQA